MRISTAIKTKIETTIKTTMIVVFGVIGMTACGAGDGWERMNAEGVSVSFEMPKPIKMNFDEKENVVVYAAQKGKVSFKVGILHRKDEQQKDEQQNDANDEKILTTFAQRVLAGSQQVFKQMGFTPQFKLDGSFQVDHGKGQQYEATVGKALVLDRFYINKEGLYFVEVTTQDPQDKDVARFLESFKI